MTRQDVRVNLEVMYAALLREPRLRALSPEAFEAVKSIIAILPWAVGEKRLGEKVTVAGFFLVAADFYKAILDSPFDLNLPDGGFLRSELELLEKDMRETSQSVGRYLVSEKISEAEALRSDDFPFSRRARRLISRRQLTFHRVIHIQPAIFLPEISPD